MYKYQILNSDKTGLFAYAGMDGENYYGVFKKDISGEENFVELVDDADLLFEKDESFPRGIKIFRGSSAVAEKMFSGKPNASDKEIKEVRESLLNAEELMKNGKVFTDK